MEEGRRREAKEIKERQDMKKEDQEEKQHERGKKKLEDENVNIKTRRGEGK